MLVKGVRECGPTPFLLRTYEIVDDPSSNSIISWTRGGTCFIIWDHIRMAVELLPKYFKHSNFSSFVYQLNNYGFRKIGLEQWEYENEWFQAGKKHLLVNIKRREQRPKLLHQRGRRKRVMDTVNSEMEAELDDLSNVLRLSKAEIDKLKQQLEEAETRIAFFKEQMKNEESKSWSLVTFLAKSLGQKRLEDVIQLIGEEEETGSSENGKKRKLLSPESTENAEKDSAEPNQEEGTQNLIPDENASKTTQDLAYWMKLLGDDPCENEAEREAARQQAKIDMELEDMIACNIAVEVSAKPANRETEEEISLQLWV